MPSFNITFTLQSTNRAQMRKDLITQFMQEQPGTGRQAFASRYNYTVESLNTSYGIFLKRPTTLNKGFDFTVNISGLFFKKNRCYTNPSHNDIINALIECKNNFSNIYQMQIKQLLQDVYDCKPVMLSKLTGATFSDYLNNKHPIEIIILAVKWLFIEQDCAYWNYSGREMFYNTLKINNLI